MSADAPPDAFGRFRVVRSLGRGGMGAVYLAEDTLLERQVAIKVPLLDKRANPKIIQRFLREARAAARVKHPNVCPVLEIGEQGQGYYLVMPYLEGTPLNQLVGREHPWEPARALDLMIKLTEGVRAIHDQHLIHRDLKPGNTLIQTDGEPVILDLGLACSVAHDSQRLTRMGQVLGTPPYAAPEQIAGDLKRLGPATDIYALGVILYELLTGQPIFTGPLHVLCAQILHGTPPMPSTLRPELGPEVDAVFRKASAREPGQRYTGVGEFTGALRAWRSVLTKRVGVQPRATEPMTQHRAGIPTLGSPDTLPGSLLPPVRVRTVAAETDKDNPGGSRPGRRVRAAGLAALGAGALVVGFLALLVWMTASPDETEPIPRTPPGQADGQGSASHGIPTEPPPVALVPKPSGELPKEIVNSLGMKLVFVPPGKFIMGSPKSEKDRDDDETLHEVEISQPFYTGAFEVTQKEFETVMGFHSCYFSISARPRAVRFNSNTKPRAGARQVRGLDTSSFPAENVSWEEATEFCTRLSALVEEQASGRVYRLPTESEWEYACREGGSATTPFHFGPTLTSHQANFDGNYPYGTVTKGPNLQRPAKVGSFQANALGLFDMHGNVWEWCSDWYEPYPTGAAKDPKGPTTGTGRTLRGGGWNSRGKDANGFSCRAADRHRLPPGHHGLDIGFRVVCDLPKTP